MELTIINKKQVKHNIVVFNELNKDHEFNIVIVRLRDLGGIPQKITKSFKSDVGFNSCLGNITKICEFDDELFTMICDNQKEL